MVNIKVPINLKGAIKIDSEQFQKDIPKSLGDLQFLKKLTDRGEIIASGFTSFTLLAGVNIVFGRRPTVGETSYFLDSRVSCTTPALWSLRLINFNTGDNEINISSFRLAADTVGSFFSPPALFSLVGNGIRQIEITADDGGAGGVAQAFTVGWEETTTSSKGTIVSSSNP